MKICSVIIAILSAFTNIAGCDLPNQNLGNSSAAVGANSSVSDPSPLPEEESPSPFGYQELGTYIKGSDRQKKVGVCIEPNITKDQAIELSKWLHKHDPKANYVIFTSNNADQFLKFQEWDINYPNEGFPYPEKWVKKFHFAMINPMTTNEGTKWQLIPISNRALHFFPEGEFSLE
jgi:hypothetical protein